MLQMPRRRHSLDSLNDSESSLSVSSQSTFAGTRQALAINIKQQCILDLDFSASECNYEEEIGALGDSDTDESSFLDGEASFANSMPLCYDPLSILGERT